MTLHSGSLRGNPHNCSIGDRNVLHKLMGDLSQLYVYLVTIIKSAVVAVNTETDVYYNLLRWSSSSHKQQFSLKDLSKMILQKFFTNIKLF